MAGKRRSTARQKNVVEARCRNWEELMDAFERLSISLPPGKEGLWFRGNRQSSYKLLPTLMRLTDGLSDQDHDTVERDLFFEFQARAAELRERGLSDWEYLFFGRHHAIPTRLLDWSDTFFVALYFALEEWRQAPGQQGSPVVWMLNPFALNEQTWGARDIILPRYLGLVEDGDFWDFGELLAGSGDWSWDDPVAIYPIQLNQRIRAQRGWFTIHGNERSPLEEQCPGVVAKLVLEQDCIGEARALLDLAGYNRFSIYPDLDNLAIQLREQREDWVRRQKSVR